MKSPSEGSPGNDKVRFSELLPHEFRERLKARPLAYLPLGTLEWHGEHLPLGSDAIISEGVMVAAAQRLGGIVLPPIHLGPDSTQHSKRFGQLQGMDYVDVSSPRRPLEGSCYWVPQAFFLELLLRILEQLKRSGFRAVFADGHGPSRTAWNQNKGVWEDRFSLRLFGVVDFPSGAWKSQLDHAALNETSLVMTLRPDLPDLAQLPSDRSIWPLAVDGEDPRDSTPELGQELLEGSLKALARIIEEDWN